MVDITSSVCVFFIFLFYKFVLISYSICYYGDGKFNTLPDIRFLISYVIFLHTYTAILVMIPHVPRLQKFRGDFHYNIPRARVENQNENTIETRIFFSR